MKKENCYKRFYNCKVNRQKEKSCGARLVAKINANGSVIVSVDADVEHVAHSGTASALTEIAKNAILEQKRLHPAHKHRKFNKHRL